MHTRQKAAVYVRLINSIGESLAKRGFAKPVLHAEQLIYIAQRKTGLDIWGDESFRPGLDRLITSLNTQAHLSQIGRIAAYGNILDHLCVRLRLNHYRSDRPEVAAQIIKRPLFILGLPRTGTTILHELIAQDPAFRSPASWEVARPVPPPTAQRYYSDPQIAKVDRMLKLLDQLSPGFQAIHALGAALPQECVYLLASSFISEQFGYMYNVSDYRNWVLDQDMTSAYAWHAKFLQHLQVDNARERWVLKTPAHLANVKYLLAQYPDATIVWTHRRPLDAISSFSSLACALRLSFSNRVDPLAIGAYEFQHFSQIISRGMTDRSALDAGQFIDVSFDAICADPMSTVRSIYDRLDMSLSDEARLLMRDYLERRPRNLYGEHRYCANEFGLDATQERHHYADYLSQYGDYL